MAYNISAPSSGHNYNPNMGGGWTPSSETNIGGLLPTGQREWKNLGMGVFEEGPLKGPSAQQVWGGILQDFQLTNRLNETNFQRKEEAADLFLRGSTQATEGARNAGQAEFDEARRFQQAGAEQAHKDAALLNTQLDAAQSRLDKDRRDVSAMYNQAVGAIGEGVDRVASDAAAGIQRKKESDMDTIRGQMGEFTGTEAQIDEAARQRGSNYDRELFGTVANLQYGAARDKSAVLQAKANTFASLATTTAEVAGKFAQVGHGARENANKWNEFGVNIASANAQLAKDRANTFAELTQMNYSTYAALIDKNPVLGATVTPSLLSMNEAAKRYGERGRRISPQSELNVEGPLTGDSHHLYNYGGGEFGSSIEHPQAFLNRYKGGYT